MIEWSKYVHTSTGDPVADTVVRAVLAESPEVPKEAFGDIADLIAKYPTAVMIQLCVSTLNMMFETAGEKLTAQAVPQCDFMQKVVSIQ